MTETVFLRLLDPAPEEKASELARLVANLRTTPSAEDLGSTFLVVAHKFSAVPESPLAYWAGEDIRRVFKDLPRLEGNAGTARVGLQTSDDFRFVRAWWEVAPERIGYEPRDTDQDRGWIHFAKGGSYSPYYADVHLLVNWFGCGREIKNRLNPSTGLPWSNVWMLARTEKEFFYRSGLTWPSRTVKGFSLRQLPEGTIFGHKGPAIISADDTTLLTQLAIGNSQLWSDLIHTQMVFGSYEVGVVQRTPMPSDLPKGDPTRALDVISLVRLTATRDETTHDFRGASLTHGDSSTLSAAGAELDRRERERREQLSLELEAVEQYVRKLYQCREDDPRLSEPGDTSYDQHGQPVTSTPTGEELAQHIADLLMWCVGVAFGRWDVRMARDPSLIPELQGPFDRLPQVAPGGLVGPDALPATRARMASETWLRARADAISLPEPGSFEGPDHITASDYPVRVAWDGVLVDDPGHRRDIVGRVREVLRFVYGADRAGAIEDEALDILRSGGTRPASLRDWFRSQRAGGLGLSFFDFHIRRYSKSRRKAPIYWRLCTSSGRRQSRYGVWLYCHRLTDDTLWTVLNDYVGPRREREERKAEELKRRIEGAPRSEVRRLEGEREEAISVLDELESFEGQLRKVAEGGWTPEPDDGVVINLAPLHAVVPWQEPENVWTKLERGDYDWAHLALRCWPERVREKCQTDKSFAIAHGQETGPDTGG